LSIAIIFKWNGIGVAGFLLTSALHSALHSPSAIAELLVTTLCLKKTTLPLHSITSMHINRFC